MRMRKRKQGGRSLTASQARMQILFEQHKGLKEISSKYVFLEAMMARVAQNKLRSAGEVSTKLCNVSLKEGTAIGAGLAMSLASKPLPSL